MNSMLSIEPCTPIHPWWNDLVDLVIVLGQKNWFEASFDWHLSTYVLAAGKDGRVVGFLRAVIQEIGVEEDRAPVECGGIVLKEAKVLAFGVAPSERRQGVGRELQERLIADGRAFGWHQIRSFSGDDSP